MSNNISGGGNIKDFTLKSSEGENSVDMSATVVDYRYYESVLSNAYTSTVTIVETGNGGEGETKNKGVLDSLPIRGGEEAKIVIEDNFGESISVPLYVNKVRDGVPGSQQDIYVVDFSSAEHFSNQESRIIERYEGKISDHIETILKDKLKSTGKLDIDDTSLEYNFHGSDRKAFYTCTWLASKAVPAEGVGDAAGFLFFQTRDGMHFKSIDNLFGQAKPVVKYSYNNTGIPIEGKDSQIISYTIESDTEVHKNMNIGTYNNRTRFFDFMAMDYKVVDYNIETQKGGIKNAGKKVDFTSKQFTQKPTRMLELINDIGVNPKGTGDKQLDNWKGDITAPNFKAEETLVQSLMRYNQLFTVKTNIVVPGNFKIKAGDLIECDFPELESGNPTNENKQTGGIYMVAHVCHKITQTDCLTSLGLIRDSYGKKGGF